MKANIILFVCALFISTNIYSQIDPGCDDPSCPWTTLGDGKTEWYEIAPGCEIQVEYRFRACPNPEFKIIDWEVRGDNCGNLSPSTLRDWATLYLLTQYEGPIDPCETENNTVNVYSASCVYEQVCEYNSATTFSVVCDPLTSTPPYPPGSTSFTTRRHISCGDICCKQTYALCEVNEVGSLGAYIRVRKLGSPIPIGDCDGAAAIGVNPNDCIPLCGN